MFAGVVPLGRNRSARSSKCQRCRGRGRTANGRHTAEQNRMRSGARHAGERGSLHEPITPLDANWIRPCGGRCPYRWG